jgi:hypothetical protein
MAGPDNAVIKALKTRSSSRVISRTSCPLRAISSDTWIAMLRSVTPPLVLVNIFRPDPGEPRPLGVARELLFHELSPGFGIGCQQFQLGHLVQGVGGMAHGSGLGLVEVISELANFDRALSPEYSTRRPSTKWNLRVYPVTRANHLRRSAMAVNMAVKRARKAQRRKQVVAEKQRAEALDASLPARVLRAAQAPIQHCLLMEGLFETGIGTLILARGATPDLLASGVFLLDVFCLGIKDVMFKSLERDELASYMEATGSQMVSISPSDARKLLRDLAAWSHTIGFPPHRDFAAVEHLFGDASADESEADFRFGCDGKPLYIPGPFDSPSLIRRRLGQLQKHLGEDGFETAA